MTTQAPRGVHLTGSTPFATASEHFHRVGAVLPHHLKSIPDGETGPQGNWIGCQYPIFARFPKLLSSGVWVFPPREDINDLVPLKGIPAMVRDIAVNYDVWALQSYSEFRKLRDEGVISKNVKFQVCLPTPLSVMIFYIHTPYRTTVEPLYENALMKALRNIQDNIPHEDLVIQWDVVQEMSLLEDVPRMENAYGLGKESESWFEPIDDGVIERLVRVMGHVDKDVDMGMHICYGDFMHKHFIQPPSTEKAAFVVSSLLKKLDRKLDYFQFPVAKARDDEAYYDRMKSILPLIHEKGTYIYVGLVHPNDEEGTKRKLAAAQKALGDSGWGVAAECGIGREPLEGAMNVMETSKAISQPWSA
ncbi:hypothetical protein H2198_006038 [Neophaeococcomyces mojaviensis]|uniref:Uncharacterized protein n=1 Tax=Neophaeococcomyces mojaviensis TaxID=3383035 RepID=A0ACC3A3Y1_9EURO|nr:hypothetical protein H2198_006038 [Knufia sp. JES_112]